MTNPNFDCGGFTFHIFGDLEQSDSDMNLNSGCLYIENNYSVYGKSLLEMRCKGDILRVDGDKYDKAEALGYDAAMLLVSTGYLALSVYGLSYSIPASKTFFQKLTSAPDHFGVFFG